MLSCIFGRFDRNLDGLVAEIFTVCYSEYCSLICAKGDLCLKGDSQDEEYFYEHKMKCTSIEYLDYEYLIKIKLITGETHE